jgi:hypothetical protein
MLRNSMLRAAGNTGAEIEFVGANSANGASSLSINGLGLQQGDLVVAVTSKGAGSYSFSSSGWTGVTSGFPTRLRTNSISHTVCYKEMGATPDTAFSLDTPVDFLGAIAFRNAQWASTTNETSGFTSSGLAVLPSLSISTNGSAAVYLAMLDDDAAGITTFPNGTPANYTLAENNGQTGGSGAIFYRLDLSSGTESPSSIRWTSDDAYLNIGLVLEPV